MEHQGSDDMPSVIIHEKVGYNISKKINIHSYNYYLGLMAPDAPNIVEFAPKEERWMSHRRRQDRTEWREALDHFYKQEENNYPKDFLIGYYIHILTDIVYDDYFYDDVKETILKDTGEENAHKIMRSDMEEYYFKEIEEIKKILQEQDTSYDILNISQSLLLNWKNKELNQWKNQKNCKYITEEIIQELGEKVLEEYLSRIVKE